MESLEVARSSFAAAPLPVTPSPRRFSKSRSTRWDGQVVDRPKRLDRITGSERAAAPPPSRHRRAPRRPNVR